MAGNPLISIITPSYNQGEFLEQTIQSVLNQDYPNIEYIVIDGGSMDQSVEIIKQYSNYLKYWVSEPDSGQAHAINKGFVLSNGNLIGWLNADDILVAGSIHKVVKTFMDFPEIDVVYGRLERIGEDGMLLPTPVLPKDKVEFNKKLVIGECVVNQPGSFWRRRWIDQVGLLDDSLQYGLDYEYWIRLVLAGARFKRLPDTLARFRISSSSKTVKHTADMALEQIKILNQVLALPDLSGKLGLSEPEITKKARKTRSTIFLHAFYGYLKKRKWQRANYWFWRAIRENPTILLERRWLDLAWARFTRHI